jgi:hypothetical protein
MHTLLILQPWILRMGQQLAPNLQSNGIYLTCWYKDQNGATAANNPMVYDLQTPHTINYGFSEVINWNIVLESLLGFFKNIITVGVFHNLVNPWRIVKGITKYPSYLWNTFRVIFSQLTKFGARVAILSLFLSCANRESWQYYFHH